MTLDAAAKSLHWMYTYIEDEKLHIQMLRKFKEKGLIFPKENEILKKFEEENSVPPSDAHDDTVAVPDLSVPLPPPPWSTLLSSSATDQVLDYESCGSQLCDSLSSPLPATKKTHAEVKEDQRKRNSKYKTKLCRHISSYQKCPFGVHCLYLHSRNFEEYSRDRKISLPICDFKHRDTEQLEAMIEEQRMLGNLHPDWPPPRKEIHERNWLRQCILRKLINERREKREKEIEEMKGMEFETIRNLRIWNFLKL